MKPDMGQVVQWAQESGMKIGKHEDSEHFYWEGGEFVPTEKLLRLVALAYEAGARAEREKREDWAYLSPEERARHQRQLNEQMRSTLDSIQTAPKT